MISNTMAEHLSEQVNAEQYSEHLYNAMAAWAAEHDLMGIAHWLRLQAEEEHIHAMKIFNYILDRNGHIDYKEIKATPTEWDDVQSVLELVTEHEKIVSGLIYGLVDLAHQERDHGTDQFLQWFVAEQVEEESNAEALLAKLRLLKDVPGGLYMLDQEMGTRVFSPAMAAFLPNGASFGKYA